MEQVVQIVITLAKDATRILLLPVVVITIFLEVVTGLKYMLAEPDEKKIWWKQIKLIAAIGAGIFCTSALVTSILSYFQQLV